MMRTVLILGYLFAAARCVVGFSQTIPAAITPAGFQWLGKLPLDDLYSTRAMRIYGSHGVIIKEQSTLLSKDGGRSWNQLRNTGSSLDISSAWLTPSLQHLLRLSDDLLLVGDISSEEAKKIPLKEENVSYLAAAASETLQQMFLVGGRSVTTTAQQFVRLPQYAYDATTSSPRMIVPVISVSSDYGKTWQTADMEKAIGYLDSVTADGKNEIAWGPYAVYASANNGKSWKLMKMEVPDGEEDVYPVSGAIVADRAYISLKNGRLLSGEIGGQSLKPFSRLASAIGQLTFISSCMGFGVAPSTTNDEDVLMETKNGGETWFPVLRAKKFVALTSEGPDVFGATQDRAFRLQSGNEPSSESCGTRTK